MRQRVSLVLAGTLILSGCGSAEKDKNAQTSYESAKQYLADLNLDLAASELQKALKVSPKSQEFNKLYEQIESTKTARDEISNAKTLIENGMNIDAYQVLKKIVSPIEQFNVEIKGLMSDLIPVIQKEANTEISKLVKESKYSEAKESLNVVISLFSGEKSVLDDFLDQYNKVSDLQKKQSQVALSRLSKRYDKFQDVTWYSSPSSPRYRNYNAFYLYFGISDNSKLPLRLVVQYENEDWLFIQSATVNVDGENYSISGDWERDNDSRIWEWIDETLDDRAMIEAITNSKSAVIRFDGRQYYDNRTISAAQKKSLRDVLLAYDGA